MKKPNGLALEYEPGLKRKKCFGFHPDEIIPECLLCAEEGDCDAASDSELYRFVCPVCGRDDTLEEYTGLAEVHTPVFTPACIDENGNVRRGQTWFDSRKQVVLRCARCGYELCDEDGGYLSPGDSEALLTWLRDNSGKKAVEPQK